MERSNKSHNYILAFILWILHNIYSKYPYDYNFRNKKREKTKFYIITIDELKTDVSFGSK